MNLLRIGKKTINMDNVVEAHTYEPGEIDSYSYERRPNEDGGDTWGYWSNDERVVRLETTAVAMTEYQASTAAQIELVGRDADAFLKWLDANTTNLTPQSQEDVDWEVYKRLGGDMTRERWEITRGQLMTVNENLEHMDPDSPSWDRLMTRASELEGKMLY